MKKTIPSGFGNICKSLEKLTKENDKYKKIEKELGFDLTALPIVLKLKKDDIVYHKNDIDGIVQCKVMEFYERRCLDKFGYYVVDGIGYTAILSPEEHGKTWALTKKELEK